MKKCQHFNECLNNDKCSVCNANTSFMNFHVLFYPVCDSNCIYDVGRLQYENPEEYAKQYGDLEPDYIFSTNLFCLECRYNGYIHYDSECK